MSNMDTSESYIVDILQNSNINDDIKNFLEEKHDTEQFLKLIAPKYMGVYVVDRKTDLFKDILGPSYFRQIIKDKKGKYSDALKVYCEQFVIESDRAKFDFLLNYDSLYAHLNAGNTYETIYHKTDGVPVRLSISSYSKNEKDISFWVFINDNLDEKNKRLEKQRKAIYGLAREYSSVWLIDHKTLIGTLIQSDQDSEAMKMGFIHNDASYNYQDKIRAYADLYVCDEYKEEFIKKTDANNIFKEIELNTTYRVVYKRLYGGKEEYYQLDFTKVDAVSKDFIMAFKNVNAEYLEEKEKNEALQLALTAAECANEAKTKFLNSISHDIRTPMNAIIGFTALASRDIENQEKVNDYLKKITTSSDHLLSLINDVLDMSRIESGKMKIEENEVHLPDVFNDIRTIMQPDIKAHGIDLFFDTLGVKNEDVICDRLRLNQVMINLLNNAIKFSKPGGIISVRLIQKPNAPKGYADYEIHVKDNGIGMSKDFQKHVFEAFAREETSTVSRIQGSGLGMAITKNIVNLMDGTIKVNSKQNVGTEFILNFRFRLTNNPAVYEKIEQLQNVRALVVDDDMNCCCSLSDMLSDIGLRSDWSTSGKEAIVRTEFAMNRNDPYGVYIIDWSMPDMNGIETVRRIRKIIGEDTPIIIMTAYDYTDIEEEARLAGVNDFCSKPIFMSELREVLAKPFEAHMDEKDNENDFSMLIGKKILLAEDNKLNQEVAKELLIDAGLVIDVVEDGDLAVAKMRYAKENQYDLILMDIQMPRMDGFTAAKEIRTLSNSNIANIPIIALTADAFIETKKAVIEAGMNGHVAKPLNVKEVLKTIKEVLY